VTREPASHRRKFLIQFSNSHNPHRHCERSEAIQNTASGRMDCFVAALLATTWAIVEPRLRIRATQCARVVHEISRPSNNRGRRESRMPNAPAASRAKCRKHTSVVTTGSPDSTRPSLHNGFNGLFRALPGDRAFLSPSPALLLADLTPASRRQDHTIWPSAGPRPRQKRSPTSTASRPASVTIAIRPSRGAGRREL
jgi:hypothetical protein